MIGDVLQFRDLEERCRPGKRPRLVTVERWSKQREIRFHYDSQDKNNNCAASDYQLRHSRLLITCGRIRSIGLSVCSADTIGQYEWRDCLAHLNCLESPCFRLRQSLKLISFSLHRHSSPYGKGAGDDTKEVVANLPRATERSVRNAGELRTCFSRRNEEIESPASHSSYYGDDEWKSKPIPERKNIIGFCKKETPRGECSGNWRCQSPKKGHGSKILVPTVVGAICIHNFDLLVNIGAILSSNSKLWGKW